MQVEHVWRIRFLTRGMALAALRVRNDIGFELGNDALGFELLSQSPIITTFFPKLASDEN